MNFIQVSEINCEGSLIYIVYYILFIKLPSSKCRDLKPENILLKYNEAGVSASRDLSTVDVVSGLTVKVSDFGFSRLVPVDSHTLSLLGTLLYMAPEVTENQGRYGTKVDLYSLGVVAYELATGQTAGLKTDLGR